MQSPRFIDLFAGIGGFRIAFERAGFQCVFTSEWDRFAQASYEANFGERPHGDIRAIPSDEIPDHEVLVGGFPCQPFSISGVSKKNALGRPHGFLDETQGTLFFEVARIIRDRRPKAFVLENVKNLVHHDRGRTFEIILKTLTEDLGYHVHHRVLNARSLVPQNRERIFIVGFRDPVAAREFQFPLLGTADLQGQKSLRTTRAGRSAHSNEGPTMREILEKRVDERYHLSDKLWNYLQEYKEKHRSAGHGFGFGLADLNGTARTLSARYYKDGSEILIPVRGKNPRRLTPRECARLMGFPEEFQIAVSDTQAYKQFGNSVAVPVAEQVARSVQRALRASGKATEEPSEMSVHEKEPVATESRPRKEKRREKIA